MTLDFSDAYLTGDLVFGTWQSTKPGGGLSHDGEAGK